QIFMGDTGSQFLGYSLGFLAVLVTQNVHPSLSPALTLLFLGLPVIDLLGVMLIRMKNGRNPLHADRTHIHHRLLDLGFDHYETVVIIYSLQAILVISAIFLRYQSDFLIILLYVTTAATIYGLITFAERTGWRTGSEAQERTTLFSTVHYFRSHKIDIIRIAQNLIKIIIPLYFIAASLLVESIPRDFGLIAAVLFAVMTLDIIFHKDKNSFSLSGGIYIAAIFSVYLVGHSEVIKEFAYLDIIPFIFLAGAIAVVVRYAMDKKFQTSTMDYLIVFGVLAIAVFGGRYLQVKDVGILIIKCMVILYGCEVLLTRMEKRINSLSVVSLIALVILAYRGLLA
ncbi:MAG: MraY family glycosyltransferase, partial [Gammaproteobacteria bacterium]